MSPREAPKKRTNPSGKVVWIARYTDSRGRRRIAKPSWNRYSGTFTLKREAQRAIDEAYALPDQSDSFRGFYAVWQELYPRSERTNDTNRYRIDAVIEVEIEGKPLGDWSLAELKRRHTTALIGHMLGRQKRTNTGAANILRTLSAFMEDAIAEELADSNPFRGVKVKANDPRVKTKRRPIRVFSFEQMREFAAAARPEVRKETERPKTKGRRTSKYFSEINYEPMLLTFPLTGMRLGEILALRRSQFGKGMFHPTGTAYRGRIIEGDTDEKIHTRPIPCPPSLEFAIQGVLRPDTEILFPTPKGTVWASSNFYRDVWRQAQLASGLDIRPHECRHSYITHLRAAGVDDADLAQVAGHALETMIGTYSHPLGESFDLIRKVLG